MSPGKELSSWQEGRVGSPGRQPQVKSKEYAGLFSNTRRNYVKFPFFLFAKYNEEVINMCPLPVSKCNTDFAESMHTNFIDCYLNVKDIQ